MNLLKALIEDNDTIWFYCRNERLAKCFLEQCEKEGFIALNGQKPTKLFRQKFYGIFDDMTMGYLSNMIWCLTFQTGLDDHVRIDYEKYISDADDYICHETKYKNVDYSDWNRISYSNGLSASEFAALCDTFIEGQSFEEYNAYIYRYLMESEWHYTPEHAVERMMWEDYLISKCYSDKIPVVDCAVEVGFGCG